MNPDLIVNTLFHSLYIILPPPRKSKKVTECLLGGAQMPLN